MEDFISLVEEMRRAQRRYFRERTQEALRASKQLEREVDAWIRRHREESGKPETQGRLLQG